MGEDGQLQTFILTMVTGMLLGIVFDFYRVVRGILRPRWFATAVTDLVYWLLATVLVFLALLAGNGGEFRFYVLLGLLGGGGAYYRLASRRVTALLLWLVLKAIKIMKMLKMMVFHLVIGPALWLGKWLITPLGILGKRIFTKKQPEEEEKTK
ncbi:MAG: yabQ [Firmicutes bacterium]|nr:yabQ [Bacillota bacterium]